MGAERRLVNVVGAHPHLVVAGTRVQLGEEVRAVEFVQEFVDDRDRERVLDREGVEGVVVDAKSPRTISFLDEEDQRREGRVAASNDALHEHGCALAFQLVLLGCWVPVRPNGDWGGAGLEDDGVVTSVLGWQSHGLGEDVPIAGQELIQEHPTGRCDSPAA